MVSAIGLGHPPDTGPLAVLFEDPEQHCAALGLTHPDLLKMMAYGGGPAAVIARMQRDDAFVHRYAMESLRETFVLDYPSYILALAMRAGKTILMGAIVASEFALALEETDPDGLFIHNALVFAPGKSILGALCELADIPFERRPPPRLLKPFAASFKLTFTPAEARPGPLAPTPTRGRAYAALADAALGPAGRPGRHRSSGRCSGGSPG